MTTPIKVLVSEFQARKMATENTAVIIQVRRRRGQPAKKFKAKLCDLEEIRPPYLEPLVGSGLLILSPAEALYRQYVDEISQHMGTDGTTERRALVSASRHYLGRKFHGAYSDSEADSIRLSPSKPYMIKNTGEVGRGEHWQAVVYAEDGDVLYDSLGGGDTNPDAEQAVDDDDDCGQRSLAFLRVVSQLGLGAAMGI
jgi:hypothetical protein